MSVLKLSGWSAALILAWSLNGCHNAKDPGNAKPIGRAASFENDKSSEHSTIMKKQPPKATVKQLIVFEPNAGRLGTVDFDESNRATLSTEGSGPAVEELKRVWEEISKMGELTWKQSRRDTIDGEKVIRIVGVKAKPSDDIYIDAVLNTLERKYGYTVDRAK